MSTEATLDEDRVVSRTAVDFLVSSRFVRLYTIVFGLIFFGFSTKGTFDPATIGAFWPGHFFSAQANALLDGHLWVPKSKLPGECFLIDGRCYGYFGLSPSIARLPLVLALGVQGAELTPLFIAIAAAIALWAALDLCQRILARGGQPTDGHSAVFMVLAAVVLGPGGLLMLASDPYVYQESIMWSVAGTMVAANLFWRWWSESLDRQFLGALLALVVAAGSRPTAALVGGVLAVGMVVARFFWRRLGWRTLMAAFLLASLPVLMVIGVWALKFGSLLPPNDAYEGKNFTFIQYNVSRNDGKIGNSPKFIPTATLTYMRPDTLKVSTDWPFVQFRFGRPYGKQPLERITYVPPAKKDSINVEPIVSLTNVAPIPLVATVLALLALVRRRRDRVGVLVILALATALLITTTAQTIAARYLTDAYPLLAVGTAFSAVLLPRLRRASRGVQTLVLFVVGFGAIVSVPIVLAIAAQYNWAYRYGIQ